jgi:hypothetical protein
MRVENGVDEMLCDAYRAAVMEEHSLKAAKVRTRNRMKALLKTHP